MSILARALIQSGLIADTQAIERCVQRAHQRQTSLPAELVTAALIDSKSLTQFIANTFGVPCLDAALPAAASRAPLVNLTPTPRYLAVDLNGKRLQLAMADPTDDELISTLRFQTALEIDPCVANVEMLARLAERAEQRTSNVRADPSRNNSVADQQIEDAPVVRFLQKTLSVAIERGASDIHFEPYEHNYRIRYRIDGILQPQTAPPDDFKDMVASRLKILAKLDIAEKRLPQDGQLRARTDDGTLVDLRISTMPTLYGEKIVLRILDRQDARLSINELGLTPGQLKQLMQAIQQPSGMILVTGPTGSGKTVTLYACLNELNQTGTNIATVEDPVEIPVQGINQVNIDERTGLSFAVALRAFMRQDPDILMVGEIRDTETAEIAVKAAQTGHLVLSTLHTRSAPATLERLRQLGLPDYSVAGSVLLVIAQRLVRRLCDCRTPVTLSEMVLRDAGFSDTDLRALNEGAWQLYQPIGCPRCHGTGYRGRIGIFEVMPVTSALQNIMLHSGSASDLARQCQLDGIQSLRQAGLTKVRAGLTSLTEILAETETPISANIDG
jgi:type IV pilus assembly protein PilB